MSGVTFEKALAAFRKYILYKQAFGRGEHDDYDGVQRLEREARKLKATSFLGMEKLHNKQVKYDSDRKFNKV